MFKTVDEAIHFIESQRAKRSFEDFQKIIERYQIPIDLKNVIHVAGTRISCRYFYFTLYY